MRSSFGRAILLVLALFATAAGPANAQAPDAVLVNGKIVTVDDRFTIAQALAIKTRRAPAHDHCPGFPLGKVN